MDYLDDSTRLAGETMRVYTKLFVKYIIILYGEEIYSRLPTGFEIEYIEISYAVGGFP